MILTDSTAMLVATGVFYGRCNNVFTEQSFSMIEITRGFFLGSFNTNFRCPLITAISKSPFV